MNWLRRRRAGPPESAPAPAVPEPPAEPVPLPLGVRERRVPGVAPDAGIPYAIAWDAAGDRLAASFGEGTAVVAAVDGATGFQRIPVTGTSPTAMSLAWRPGTAELAVVHEDGIRMWNHRTGRVVDTGVVCGTFPRLAWSPDGRMLCVTTMGGVEI